MISFILQPEEREHHGITNRHKIRQLSGMTALLLKQGVPSLLQIEQRVNGGGDDPQFCVVNGRCAPEAVRHGVGEIAGVGGFGGE